jgi:hypothetical protein
MENVPFRIDLIEKSYVVVRLKEVDSTHRLAKASSKGKMREIVEGYFSSVEGALHAIHRMLVADGMRSKVLPLQEWLEQYQEEHRKATEVIRSLQGL